jgi:hypothetical protein
MQNPEPSQNETFLPSINNDNCTMNPIIITGNINIINNDNSKYNFNNYSFLNQSESIDVKDEVVIRSNNNLNASLKFMTKN